MGLLKKLFGSKEEIRVTDAATFWQWFVMNEKSLHAALKEKTAVQENFIGKVMPQLQKVNENFYCLAGMFDANTAELIVTPEGIIKDILFAEELIASAPKIDGWKFTALKQAEGSNGQSIEMAGYSFSDQTISFVQHANQKYPDEVAITLVHPDYSDNDRNVIVNGTYIYLDNFLGELNTVTLIDSIEFAAPDEIKEPLIPIEKLPEYLSWREKEFIEKYEGTRHNTEEDNYIGLEAQDENDLAVIAVFNEDLLNWEAKPSHPWMLKVEIKYDGSSSNGMPNDKDFGSMNELEGQLIKSLPDHAGYLNLGRETYNSLRSIFFACKEFRNVSRIVRAIIADYADKLSVDYEIYKDKYWLTMEKFRQ